jgi:dynein heavy chain
MVEELDITDLRVYFLADYLIKSLRLRSDKWTKMIQIEDQNRTILDFCEKPQPTLLVFHVNPAGNLVRRFIFSFNTIRRFLSIYR